MGKRTKSTSSPPSGSRPAKSLAFVAVVLFVVATMAVAWWKLGSGPSAARAKTDRDNAESRPDPWFKDVAKSVGVDFRHSRGAKGKYWFPEIVGGGVALFDYDNDGDLDLYFVQSGTLEPGEKNDAGNVLYRNRGDGTFEDVTGAAGVGDTGYGMGCAAGDFDNDGHVDLYVTNYGKNVLYRNQGDGTFKNVTDAAGVSCPSWSVSAAFADFDADGLLDLFVTNYVSWSINNELKCRDSAGRQDYCQPSNYNAPAVDTLYRNLGNGKFEDVTEKSGISVAFGNGLGVCHGDFNGDGQLDFYVANDGMPNQLWMNQGGGKFKNRALLAGCAVNSRGTAEAGMGVQAADVDDDGDLDFFITHLRGETNTLFVNDGGMFEDSTARSGLGTPSLRYTGWGVGFHDFDHDGVLDVYIANGSVGRNETPFDPADAYAEPNLLMRGLGRGRFEPNDTPRGVVDSPIGSSRAAAFGDIDNDGDVDIVVVEQDGPARVMKNIVGDRGAWAAFKVIDQRGRDAIGAMLRIQPDGRSPVFRQVEAAYSFSASNDPRVHVGIGSAERIERVDVTWPDGAREWFGPFKSRSQFTIQQGKGKSDAIHRAAGE